MANRLAVKHGRQDARIFAAENPGEVAQALKPGQSGADEALINALGIGAAAALFGLARGGTRAFSLACAEYNRAFVSTLAKLAAEAEVEEGAADCGCTCSGEGNDVDCNGECGDYTEPSYPYCSQCGCHQESP